MLIPLIVSGIWFSALEKSVLKPEFLMYTKVDDYIPFTPFFVIPYVLWYAYVAVPAFFLFWKSPREFTKIALFLTAGMFIACTVYTLFPNGQALRPSLRGQNELLVKLIDFIYLKDTPANCAPSIHVIYSVAAHAAIYHYNSSRRQIAWVNIVSAILSCLCILSTVFIKQHSAVDLIAGLFVSGVLYVLIYQTEHLKRRKRREPQAS